MTKQLSLWNNNNNIDNTTTTNNNNITNTNKSKNNLRSPIKYFGSKFFMMKEIQAHFPKDIRNLSFIEGFGGGASVLFSKEPYGVEIYNDLDENVYSLFKVISDKQLFSEFKNKLDVTPYSRELRDEFKNDLKQEISLLDRAYKFFYVNRTSFNGCGGFASALDIRRNMNKSVSDYLSMVDYLPEIHQRFSRIVIEHLDINALLKRYNKEDVFYYLDPPYVHSSRKSLARYNCEMTDEQHIEMLNIILNHKSKFLISGYKNDIYNILLENGWNEYSFKSPLSDSIETLWWNYDI